jgi:hypothetical protein
MGTTIQQFYASGRYVPREILVAEEVPERDLLEAWLSERRGTLVKIRTPQRGEKVRLLELVVKNAEPAFDLEWKHPRQQSQEILRALRDVLDLELEPRRIECFDISNIQGADIVASMVVFEDGMPKKSDYRKFRIKTVVGAPDDFASMREVVGVQLFGGQALERAHVFETLGIQRGRRVQPQELEAPMHKWMPSIVQSRSPVVPSAHPSHTRSLRILQANASSSRLAQATRVISG